MAAQSNIQKPIVSVHIVEEEGLYYLQTAKSRILTPKKQALAVPSKVLAEVVAKGVEEQGQKNAYYKMASYAADMTAQQQQEIHDELMNFVDADLVCYRANEPADLVEWQSEYWDDVVVWAKKAGFGQVSCEVGIQFFSQPDDIHENISQRLKSFTPWELVPAATVSRLSGSVLLALMFMDGKVSVKALRDKALADMLYQVNRYQMVDTQQQEYERLEKIFKEVANFRKFLLEK